jgi:hypothetical protein
MADDEPPVDGTVNAILRYRHLPPIPTRFDRKLGDLDDLNGVVMTKLRTIRHAGDACDLGGLRELATATAGNRARSPRPARAKDAQFHELRRHLGSKVVVHRLALSTDGPRRPATIRYRGPACAMLH